MTEEDRTANERLGLPHGVRACLFDLDGVLTKTAAVHAAAWKQMFDEFLAARGDPPFEQSDYEAYVDGRPRLEGTRGFLQSRGIDLPDGKPDDAAGTPTVQGLSARKNELLQERIEQDGVEVYEGSRRYVEAVLAAGLRAAVVSSSANTEQILRVTGLADLFEARIDGVVAKREGIAGKPKPDTFLAGAAALQADADSSAVFEDAVSGVQAGRAGRFALVVGVDRTGHAEELRQHGADVVVQDLEDLLRDRGDQ